MKHYLVFDVESTDLHGEGFAYGYVVINSEGEELESGIGVADVPVTNPWVITNVLPALPPPTHDDLRSLRDSFWAVWDRWLDKGAVMVADCSFPVETRFLAACVDDAPMARNWYGPYPLHDVATARLAVGLDPLATEARRGDELPVHNPLADARQSARLWLEAFRAANG